MDKEALQLYAEYKIAIKELEAKIEELQPKILEAIIVADVEEVEVSGMGTFCLGKRRKWTYTPATLALEDEVKAKKKNEEQTGDASYVENPYIIFKGLKE